jgi:hypothetical protein
MTRIVHRRHVAIDGREERPEGRIEAREEQRQRGDRGQGSAMFDRRHERLRERTCDFALGEAALPPQPSQLRADGTRERGSARGRGVPAKGMIVFRRLINS